MSSAVLTSVPDAAARLVVDTDVASFIFKWHPEFAPRYLRIVRGFPLFISFMTVAEMRQGALAANRGSRKLNLLDAYLADFSVLDSSSLLCSKWAGLRDESERKGRPIRVADGWVAASAVVLNAPLVTNNPSDYQHLDGLQLVAAVQ